VQATLRSLAKALGQTPAPGSHTPVPEPDALAAGGAGRAVIRGGAYRAAAYAGSILLSAASVPLVVRALGVEDYGRFVTITSLITIVGGVTDAGLENIGVREFSVLSGGARDSMIRHLIGVRMTLTVVGVLIAVGVGALAGYDHTMMLGILVAGGGLLIQVLHNSYVVSLIGSLRLGWVSTLDIVKQVVAVGYAVVLVLVGAGLLPFFFMTVLSGLAALAIVLPLTRRLVPLLPSVDMRWWWRLMREALPYAAATAIGIVYFRIAIIILSLVSNGQQTGYFGASFRIVEVLSAIPYMLVMSAFPVLARAAHTDHDRLRYALQRTFEVALILGVWMMLGVLVGAPFAIRVVAGHGFDPSIPVLRIQGIALAATFLAATWGYALLSLRRYRALMLVNALALAITVTLTLVLAPGHGAKGAAISMTVTEVCLALGYAVALMGRRPDFRVSPRVVVPVALGAGIGGAAAALSGIPSWAGILLASACYLAVLALGRAVPPEVLDMVKRSSTSRAGG
jgi:O-antigen/teichoic acid export membrane protein